MKLILMGTNDFVVPIFDTIKNAGHDIVAVFTRAPKLAGRKHILTKSPVHVWGESNNLPIYTSIKQFDSVDRNVDYIVVVSYGVILGDNVLNAAPVINIHPSDLPNYRGPSPIKTAIYNGDTTSAVCLMKLVPELDAGDVYMRVPFEIGENDTNEIVEKRISKIGGDMLTEFLLSPEKFAAQPQSGTPTYTRKFTGDDEIIDWKKSPREIHNQIRALGCGRTKINGIDVKILETKIENNELKIITIQPAGKKPMDWKSFINGLHGETIKMGE
ncbi:MAG: hypothetical protein J6S74_03515 [Alphaproteobacteria bacterium]|nr:hypothetical protein [Alphaproteobacteria bacterium]